MDHKNTGTWMKPRHRVVRNIAYVLLYPYIRLKYHIKIRKFREQGDRPYLILLNHQTPFDQFFVGCAFRGPIYYLASEDLFSNGWISSVIRWLVAPIPIRKQTTDIAAVKTCLRVAREGGTIAIAPEGNRTYSGKTEYMNPSIASMAKKLGLPIALFRIEGGYGVQPRWSDVVRKGKMKAYVSRVIEPEEYSAMSREELFNQIRDGLYVNEGKEDGIYMHRDQAQYLERVVYTCPYCGLAKWKSRRKIIQCTGCGRKLYYLLNKELVGIQTIFPFDFVNDWYEFQQDFVRKLDLTCYLDEPMFTDTARLFRVILNKRKENLHRRVEIRLFGDRIELRSPKAAPPAVLRFDDLWAVTVLGRNKLNIYLQDNTVYQFQGSKRFNALKYVNIYHHFRNTQKGDNNGEFLGL